MSTEMLSKPIQEVIREAARLIHEKGFSAACGNNANHPPQCGINLTTAVCWAIHGTICRPRELSPLESQRVAETLDLLEDGLEMPVPTYEHQNVLSTPADVSHDLRHAAWKIENELEEDAGGKSNSEPS